MICDHGIHMENACGKCQPPRGTTVVDSALAVVIRCAACNMVGMIHCHDPNNCGEMKEHKPQ